MSHRSSGIPVSSLVVDILFRDYSRNTVTISIQIEQGDGSPSPSSSSAEEIFCFRFDIIIDSGKRRCRGKRRYEQMVRVLRVVATGSAPPAGAQVRVIKPVQVYHVGKFNDGLSLEGRVGTVVEDVSAYEGKVLSATLPYKVEFSVDGEGDKPVKVLAHVDADEIELADPLEQFCEEDPSADECRVYE